MCSASISNLAGHFRVLCFYNRLFLTRSGDIWKGRIFSYRLSCIKRSFGTLTKLKQPTWGGDLNDFVLGTSNEGIKRFSSTTYLCQYKSYSHQSYEVLTGFSSK